MLIHLFKALDIKALCLVLHFVPAEAYTVTSAMFQMRFIESFKSVTHYYKVTWLVDVFHNRFVVNHFHFQLLSIL